MGSLNDNTWGLCPHCGHGLNGAECCDVCGYNAEEDEVKSVTPHLYAPQPVVLDSWFDAVDPYVLVSGDSFNPDHFGGGALTLACEIHLGAGEPGITFTSCAIDDALCFTPAMAHAIMDAYRGKYVALPLAFAIRLKALSQRLHYQETALFEATSKPVPVLPPLTPVAGQDSAKDPYVLVESRSLSTSIGKMVYANGHLGITGHLDQTDLIDFWDVDQRLYKLRTAPNEFFALPVLLAQRIDQLLRHASTITQAVIALDQQKEAAHG